MKCNKIVIGITGGPGTGKTTVLEFFKKLGAYTFDSDEIYHSLIKPGNVCWKAIIKEFGKEYLSRNEKINRKKLANLVFEKESARKKLERITHLHIIKEIRKKIKKSKSKIIAVEIPLLVEARLFKDVDYVLLVTCSKTNQIKRLKNKFKSCPGTRDTRDGWKTNKIKKVISSQFPLSVKRKYADFIINNDRSKQQTYKNLHSAIKNIAYSKFPHLGHP